eukprot:31466-Pelagococcus_subviridis.AAC.5
MSASRCATLRSPPKTTGLDAHSDVKYARTSASHSPTRNPSRSSFMPDWWAFDRWATWRGGR